MRHALAAALSLLLAAACSSSTDGEECTIVGTYTVSAETEGGDCPDAKDGMTYTISRVGDAYGVEIQGLSGGCIADPVGTCKLQGKCDLAISDATDPSNARGTAQYSWTFTGSGFSGSMAISIPPAASLPGGCSGSSRQTATRR